MSVSVPPFNYLGCFKLVPGYIGFVGEYDHVVEVLTELGNYDLDQQNVREKYNWDSQYTFNYFSQDTGARLDQA